MTRPLHSTLFPAQAGTQTLSLRRETARRTPAFAGHAVEGSWMNTPHSQPSPPQGGKGLYFLALSLWERVG
jgi:hypothetical protein